MVSRSWTFRCFTVLVVLLGGCGWFSRPPSLPGGYLIPSGEPPSTVASQRVFLVADNQVHNVYGEPIPVLRTGLVDKIVQSAIRPIQLDFYGQDFLKWLVDSRSQRYPIVHVGDACNLSCTGEFSRFWEIMRRAKKGWVMAPGNHDGYFFGNYHRDPAGADWQAACRNAGRPMTKDRLVRLYLAALILQEGPGYQALARHLGLDGSDHTDLEELSPLIPERGDWRYAREERDERPFLRAISWRIDKTQPWRSFVVQEADLSLDRSVFPDSALGFDISIRVILLDTTQYHGAPTLVPLPPATVNAGLTGELLIDQFEIVQSWVNSHPDGVWVLLGHHPFDSLSQRTLAPFDDLRRTAKALLYVSAHTHAGQFMVHGSGKDRWLELNVGSILDWSLEVRTLQFYRAGERLMLRSPRFTMHELLRRFEGVPTNDELWEAKPGEADYYLRHEDLKDLDAFKTEIRLKNALLAAHHRLLRFNRTQAHIPGDASFWPPDCQSDDDVLERIDRVIRHEGLDEKIEFLMALNRFERERPVADPEKRSKFRLSQAIWASKYDSVHARQPLVDDWFIIFPEE